MDPRTNPYAPGAGSPPPELAGRDPIIDAASIALDRMRNGLVARSLMLVGLRGVGAMKVKYDDIEFGLDLGSEPGIADSGDLEADLISSGMG